jgi:hypothetical protein
MSAALHLRAALKRGALVALSNWPLVIVQLAADSLYKLALAVPVVGGVFVVSVIAGADASQVLSKGLTEAAQKVFDLLASTPAALGCFVLALGLVAAGAAVVMWVARAGMLPLLVAGELAGPDPHRLLMTGEGLRQARAWSFPAFLDALRRFSRRYMFVGSALVLTYIAIGAAFAVAIVASDRLSDRGGWSFAWPFVALLIASAAVIAIVMVNLLADLLQVIIASRDCSVAEAWRSLRAFLVHDARQVAGVFGVVLGLVTLATLASILVVASLWMIASVPFIGVIVVVPLQIAAWFLRGVVFEYVDVTALSAYISQYRRFSERQPELEFRQAQTTGAAGPAAS